MYILLICAVGIAGAFVGKKLKLPAAAMIGAMVFVVILNVVSGFTPRFPANLRFVVQACSGMIIGSRITRKDVQRLKELLVPALILVAMLLVLNVLFAVAIASFSSLDMITSLFSCAPGGVSDMAIISADFGADVGMVTLLQLARFIFVVSFFPFYMRKHNYGEENLSQEDAQEKTPLTTRQKLLRTGLSIGGALAGGWLFRWLGIPAGAILGSMMATIGLSLATEKVYINPWTKLATQTFAGSYIGSQVTRVVILSMGQLVIPLILLIVEVFIMAFGCSKILRRLAKVQPATAIFSSMPGGITEMGLVAEEMKLDLPVIMLMNTCRVIGVVCLLPILIKIVSG